MIIIKIEIKQTEKGDDYKRCTTDKPDGEYRLNFNVFKFHSRFSEVEEGMKLEESDLIKDGKYWNLVDPDQKKTSGSKTGAIKQAQETKRVDIATAQGRRDEGIKVSSTFRDATLITMGLLDRAFEKGDVRNETEFKSEWNLKTLKLRRYSPSGLSVVHLL